PSGVVSNYITRSVSTTGAENVSRARCGDDPAPGDRPGRPAGRIRPHLTSRGEKMKKPVTVTITGAAGQIGYALAFRVASGHLLGADQPVNLHLLEITPTLPA